MYKYTYSTVVSECQFRINKLNQSSICHAYTMPPSLLLKKLGGPQDKKVAHSCYIGYFLLF